MKVVLDTNVVVSAILFGGTPRIILEAAFEGAIQAFISDQMIEELESVLTRPRFGLNKRIVQNIINEITNIAEWIEPKRSCKIIKDDPSDDMMLDCAIEAKVDCIVTGDNHLLALNEFEGIAIVTPKVFQQTYLA